MNSAELKSGDYVLLDCGGGDDDMSHLGYMYHCGVTPGQAWPSADFGVVTYAGPYFVIIVWHISKKRSYVDTNGKYLIPNITKISEAEFKALLDGYNLVGDLL